MCALSSASSSAPTPHPSMTSHFLGCLCMLWGGGVGMGVHTEREKRLASLLKSPHLGKKSADEVRVGPRQGTRRVDRDPECRAAAEEPVLSSS